MAMAEPPMTFVFSSTASAWSASAITEPSIGDRHPARERRPGHPTGPAAVPYRAAREGTGRCPARCTPEPGRPGRAPLPSVTMGAQATLNPVRLSVAPGGEAHADISVTNIGQVVDAFTLQVLGDAAGWTACEPRAISLLPGQGGTARIMIKPPLSPDLPYGPVPFAVRVASTEDP